MSKYKNQKRKYQRIIESRSPQNPWILCILRKGWNYARSSNRSTRCSWFYRSWRWLDPAIAGSASLDRIWNVRTVELDVAWIIGAVHRLMGIRTILGIENWQVSWGVLRCSSSGVPNHCWVCLFRFTGTLRGVPIQLHRELSEPWSFGETRDTKSLPPRP